MGEGPAFIILHGLFGTLDNWQTIAKNLAEKYTVYLVDQRNHGRSPHFNSHTYVEMAEDLYTFMNEQGIPSATLLGHSMGGKTVMQFTADHEDMVDRLYVVDMAPKQYSPHHGDIIDALDSIPVATIKSRKDAETVLIDKIPDAGIRLFLLKNLSRSKTGGYEWKMNLPVLKRDYLNVIDKTHLPWPIEVKTTFIRGGDSNYILDSDFEHIEEYFPNSTVVTIENAGHWVHAQQPKALLYAID